MLVSRSIFISAIETTANNCILFSRYLTLKNNFEMTCTTFDFSDRHMKNLELNAVKRWQVLSKKKQVPEEFNIQSFLHDCLPTRTEKKSDWILGNNTTHRIKISSIGIIVSSMNFNTNYRIIYEKNYPFPKCRTSMVQFFQYEIWCNMVFLLITTWLDPCS